MVNFIKNYLVRIGIGVLVGLLLGGVFFVIDEVQMKPKIEELSGTWEGEFESDLSWEEVFETFEFYEEEVDILRDNQLLSGNVSFVDVATFTKDRKFSISSNNDKTAQLIRTHLESAFDVLYNNRTQLNVVYSEDFSKYTKADFESFYAEMYSYDSYELLLQGFVESLYDYYTVEEGTYKIDDDLIVIKNTGKSEKLWIEYKIEDGVLYLSYEEDDGQTLVIKYERVG